jgi:hypothetical protein
LLATAAAPGRLPSGAASARLLAATWRCWQLLVASAAHGGGAVAVAAPRTAALLRWTAADAGDDPEAEQFVYAYGAALLAGGVMELLLYLRRRAAKRAAKSGALPTSKGGGAGAQTTHYAAKPAAKKAGKPWLVALQATWHVLFLEGALLPALRAAGGVLDCEYRDPVQPFPYRASAPAAGACWTGQHAFAAGVAAAVAAVGYSAALHAAAAPPIKLAAAASPGGHRLAGFGVLECIVAFVVAGAGAALRHQSAALPGIILTLALLMELMCVPYSFYLFAFPCSPCVADLPLRRSFAVVLMPERGVGATARNAALCGAGGAATGAAAAAAASGAGMLPPGNAPLIAATIAGVSVGTAKSALNAFVNAASSIGGSAINRKSTMPTTSAITTTRV